MTKLDKSKFIPLFGTWWPKFEKFFDEGGFDPIYEQLKFDSKRGVKIAPLSHLVYRCFQETPIEDVKCVLLSYCPYHTFINGSSLVADGLAFSCSVTGKLQPSLEVIYGALEKEFYNGLNLNFFKNPDLSYLAKQGVLLYNCALTTAINKPGSHMALWEDFTKYFLQEVIPYRNLPLVFIGADAKKFKKYVTPLTHGQIFELTHPAAAARNYEEWETNKVFSKVQQIVKQNNGVEIKWLDEDTCPF
jgi:uracil-DNA glycosylase